MKLKILSLIICFSLAIHSAWFNTNKTMAMYSGVEVNEAHISEIEQIYESEYIKEPEYTVESNEETTCETVEENTELETQKGEMTKPISLSAEDTDLMVRIAMCEAGGEDVESIASIMRVILNRVESDLFPNSIRDVIYQKKQFTPVSTGWINTVKPSEKCYKALKMVTQGWDESQGALYFESCSGDSWHSRNLEYLYSCDTIRFYK